MTRSVWYRLGRLAASTSLLLPLLSHAGAGVLTSVVTPLTEAVTYSVPSSATTAALTTYVGYTVSIANVSGNTINNVRFTGTASATDTDEKVLFSSVEGASCTVSTDRTAIECAIGQLKAGQAAPVFAVFFQAPAKDTVSPIPNGVSGSCATTDCVNFSGVTYYAEGTGGPNSVPQNSTTIWAAAPVTLGTNSPTFVKSAVQKSGGALFTGNGAVSTGADKFTTRVVVPLAATYTTAEIQEADITAANCSPNFNTCFRSDITVPGTFNSPNYLTFVLRQDSSTILSGTKIESVLIQYTPTGSTQSVFVGLCANPTTPRTDGLPCIAKRTYYKNSRTPGWTLDLDGDFEWTLISTKNGSYKVF